MKRILFLVLLAAGCSPTAAVVKQASFDLNCPAEKIEVVELNQNTYGATGCEKRASYLAGCGLAGCTALVNGSPAADAALRSSAASSSSSSHH